ncbi:AMP-binding protein [uncultured Methylobacterium sp.]|uniref:AMP-binding protein n=1 Tax=uncultured Methylobacterium sp. TaxID=157278 RepID=UPI0035CBD935
MPAAQSSIERPAGLGRDAAAEADGPLRRTGLSALLAAHARSHPARIAFTDAADKPVWSGRPAMTWTYGTATEIVARLARGFRGWRLPPGSRIGLWFPGSTEGLVAHLAVEAAGHVPCPMPPAWTEAQAASGIAAAGLAAVLTQARLGAARPAESLCRIAAGYYGLRYLAAFGPDVPDGVINLDALALDRSGGGDRAGPVPESGGGLAGFARGDPSRPVERPGDALLAAIAVHLVAARIAPAERILTLLPPSDLRGIVTGLGAALLAGAALETMPVFDGAGLADALARPVPTHLVAPGFLEPALAALDLPDSVRSLVLAHRAPIRLGPRSPHHVHGPHVLDALALDEDALLSGRRGADDLALTLVEPGRLPLPPALLGLRREPDGRLALQGQACKAAPLRRGESTGKATGKITPGQTGDFRASGFRIELFAGTAIGVIEA